MPHRVKKRGNRNSQPPPQSDAQISKDGCTEAASSCHPAGGGDRQPEDSILGAEGETTADESSVVSEDVKREDEKASNDSSVVGNKSLSVPIVPLSCPEDKKELDQNENTKATKTREERREEVEAVVAAARLLRLKSTSCADDDGDDDVSSSSSSSSGASTAAERNKTTRTKKVESSNIRSQQAHDYWNSLVPEKKESFLEIAISDLKQHFSNSEHNAAFAILMEALSFAEEHKGWKFWLCCECNSKFSDPDSLLQHIKKNHTRSLPRDLISKLPNKIAGELAQMIINGIWKPLDIEAAVRLSSASEIASNDTCQHQGLHSDNAVPLLKGDSSITCGSNGAPTDQRSDLEVLDKCSLPNHTGRSKLLKVIHEMLVLLLQKKCLSDAHLNRVMQFTMNELPELPSGLQICGQPVNQSPMSICFLNVSRLLKVSRFLQEIVKSCEFEKYENCWTDDTVAEDTDCPEEMFLSGDSFKLQLDKLYFASKGELDKFQSSAGNLGISDANDSLKDFVSWLFCGPALDDQLEAWTKLKEERFSQGKKWLQMFEKEFDLIHNENKKKIELLSCEEALKDVVKFFREEAKKVDGSMTPNVLSHAGILWRRMEELQRATRMMPESGQSEINVISGVLNEANKFCSSYFQCHMSSGIKPHTFEVDGPCEEEVTTWDSSYITDICIEVSIQTLKDGESLRLSKIDARILHSINNLLLCGRKLAPALSFDYRLILVSHMKAFIRSHLEVLAEKYAIQKSDAVREAFLAELALEEKKVKDVSKQSKQPRGKSKDKKKTRERRKSKDIKELDGSEKTPNLPEGDKKISAYTIVRTPTGIHQLPIPSPYLNEEDEHLLRTEFKAETEKLEPKGNLRKEDHGTNNKRLPYQRQMHTAKNQRKFHANSLAGKNVQNLGSNAPKCSGQVNQLKHNQNTDKQNDKKSSFCLDDLKFGILCWSNEGLKKENPDNAQKDMNIAEENGSQSTTQEVIQSHSNENKGGLENEHHRWVESSSKGSSHMLEKQHSAASNSSNEILSRNKMHGTENMPKTMSIDHSGAHSTENHGLEKDFLGSGLWNEAGEDNCFLSIITESLWHLRRFRYEFLTLLPKHSHVGDPCVVCALQDVFTSLESALAIGRREDVSATCLRTALSNLSPGIGCILEGQINDAAKLLTVIFDCMHHSFTSKEPITEPEQNSATDPWVCTSSSCIVHRHFGLDIFEKMNCSDCGLESRHQKYTSFFHEINAKDLRITKDSSEDSSIDELLRCVEMDHQLSCNKEDNGCGKLNQIQYILKRTPKFFTIVLGWGETCESEDLISVVLDAFTTELDVAKVYHGLDQGNKHFLVCMVCFFCQHYFCFVYHHRYDEWVMLDAHRESEVIGQWSDVLSTCDRGRLQPLVLFFEAVE